MFFTPMAEQSAVLLPGEWPSVCLHKSTSGAALRVERGSQIARLNVAERKKKKKTLAGCWPIEPNLCAPSLALNEQCGSGFMFTGQPQLISLGTDEQRGR